jgi:hypothetical protein
LPDAPTRRCRVPHAARLKACWNPSSACSPRPPTTTPRLAGRLNTNGEAERLPRASGGRRSPVRSIVPLCCVHVPAQHHRPCRATRPPLVLIKKAAPLNLVHLFGSY